MEHKRTEAKVNDESDDQGEIIDDSFQRTVNSKDVKGNKSSLVFRNQFNYLFSNFNKFVNAKSKIIAYSLVFTKSRTFYSKTSRSFFSIQKIFF